MPVASKMDVSGMRVKNVKTLNVSVAHLDTFLLPSDFEFQPSSQSQQNTCGGFNSIADAVVL